MLCTGRLITQVAALALVAFSGFPFICSAPRAQDDQKGPPPEEAGAGPHHSPGYGGQGDPGPIGDLVKALHDGGLVILFKFDGDISAYAVSGPNFVVNPTNPYPKHQINGGGPITDIQIWEGSGCCISTTLNGAPLTVCRPKPPPCT
jgi:hypothetical protein